MTRIFERLTIDCFLAVNLMVVMLTTDVDVVVAIDSYVVAVSMKKHDVHLHLR